MRSLDQCTNAARGYSPINYIGRLVIVSQSVIAQLPSCENKNATNHYYFVVVTKLEGYDVQSVDDRVKDKKMSMHELRYVHFMSVWKVGVSYSHLWTSCCLH
jgi:hypothetical protein